jgi:hypothetical protein
LMTSPLRRLAISSCRCEHSARIGSSSTTSSRTFLSTRITRRYRSPRVSARISSVRIFTVARPRSPAITMRRGWSHIERTSPLFNEP